MTTPPKNFPTLGDARVLLTYFALNAILPRRPVAPPSARTLGAQPSRQEPLAVQKIRAVEPGRGRSAANPAAIPWRGWKDVLWRTYEQLQQDRLLAIAAGVVFY